MDRALVPLEHEGSPEPSVRHTRAVPSCEVRDERPSGLKAAEVTGRLVLRSTAAVSCRRRRHIRTIPVHDGGEDELAIRAEGGGGDRALVPRELATGEASRAIGPPHPRHSVLRGRDEELAILAEGGGLDRRLVLQKERLSHPTGPLPHTRAVLSQEVVTMRWPSGLNATEVSASECPFSSAGGREPSARHTRATPSCEAVTMLCPSGLYTAAATASSCSIEHERLPISVGVPHARGPILRGRDDALP